jgi:hypothetical protein
MAVDRNAGKVLTVLNQPLNALDYLKDQGLVVQAGPGNTGTAIWATIGSTVAAAQLGAWLAGESTGLPIGLATILGAAGEASIGTLLFATGGFVVMGVAAAAGLGLVIWNIESQMAGGSTTTATSSLGVQSSDSTNTQTKSGSVNSEQDKTQGGINTDNNQSQQNNNNNQSQQNNNQQQSNQGGSGSTFWSDVADFFAAVWNAVSGSGNNNNNDDNNNTDLSVTKNSGDNDPGPDSTFIRDTDPAIFVAIGALQVLHQAYGGDPGGPDDNFGLTKNEAMILADILISARIIAEFKKAYGGDPGGDDDSAAVSAPAVQAVAAYRMAHGGDPGGPNDPIESSAIPSQILKTVKNPQRSAT